jgi:hypothetical protein
MSKAKETTAEVGKPVDVDQAAQVAGGDGECTTTLTLGGILTTVGPTVGETVTATYDGLVDATSHVIERVANSMK